MRIGDLTHRVTLQKPTRTADGMGGYTVTWSDEEQCWAAIWPVSATERIQAGQQASSITHRVRLRYREDLRADWRIQYGTRYFAILGIVNPNESDRMLDVLCQEAAPA